MSYSCKLDIGRNQKLYNSVYTADVVIAHGSIGFLAISPDGKNKTNKTNDKWDVKRTPTKYAHYVSHTTFARNMYMLYVFLVLYTIVLGGNTRQHHTFK